MKKQKYKQQPSNIGRRSGLDVIKGRDIRRQEDGTDNFDDYWTSDDSNQTTQLVPSPNKTSVDKTSGNVSILSRDSVSYRNAPRSSKSNSLNQESGEFEDQNGYSRAERFKKPEISKKKIFFPKSIGRRTGVPVVQIEKIRKQDDGTDVYDDYFLDETTRRSSVKEILDQENGKSQDHDGCSSSEKPKRSEVSRKNSHFLVDGEISAFANSKMTQTSHLLDETESSLSKNKMPMHKKSRKSNEASLFDSRINSSVRRSPRKLPNFSQTPNRNKNMPSSRDEITDARISLSNKIESGKKTKDKKHSRVMSPTSHPLDKTKDSPFRSGTYLRGASYSKETNTNRIDSSDGKRSYVVSSSVSSVASHELKGREDVEEMEGRSDRKINSSIRKSPRKLSNSSQSPNRREDVLSPKDDTRAVRFSSFNKMESGKKAKDKRNSRVKTNIFLPLDAMEGSPFRNTTYTPKTSYSKETERNGTSSYDSERSSPGETSGVSSKLLHVRNRKKELPSSRDDSKAATVSLSNKMKSGIKAKDTRYSRVMAQISDPIVGEEGTSLKNMSDSSDSERNFSMERCSEIMSNTCSSQNSKKNTRERNSTLRPPQYAAKSSEVLNEKENIPSRNDRSRNEEEILVSGQNENEFKKKEKRKSSMRKSPIAVKKKSLVTSDDQENSSSSEVQNEIENIHSRNDRSENEEEMLVSGKNELKKKDKRKSSMRKSPIAVKKKSMATPDDLENSPSKISHIQNSWKDGNEKNFGEKIPHHLAGKSSEVQNLKQNISSRSGIYVNRLEIFESGQKDNNQDEDNQDDDNQNQGEDNQNPDEDNQIQDEDNQIQDEDNQIQDEDNQIQDEDNQIQDEDNQIQDEDNQIQDEDDQHQDEGNLKSSTKMSPSASRSSALQIPNLFKNRQVPSSSDSHKKTFPLDFIQENASSPCSVRRSSRYRCPPLAIWRNQRLKFVKSSTKKELECVGVEEGGPEDDYGVLKQKVEKPKVEKRKIVDWKKRKNDPKKLKKTPIFDARTGKTIELYLHRPFSTYEWTWPPSENGPSYMITRTFKSKFLTFGFLDIAAHKEKDTQLSPADNLHFVVIKGCVEAVINKTSITFQKGDSFIVPAGTAYRFINKSSCNALLSYNSFKIPFFKYQDMD